MNGVMIRLDTEDVKQFAEATGDRNPQYLDHTYAQRTSSGGCVLPGALVVLAALSVIPERRLRAASGLVARFTRPLFPGRIYSAALVEEEGDRAGVVVREGELPMLNFELSAGPSIAEAVVPVKRPTSVEAEPSADYAPGEMFNGGYGVLSPEALRALADRLGAKAAPDSLVGALGWASWFLGMRVPGRDTIVAGMRIGHVECAAENETRYTATVRQADARTGAVVIDVECRGDGRGVDMELRAFRRHRVPTPNWASATSVLPCSERLAGHNVLVVGGSRGIGASLVSVLVAQGATVWATQRASGPVEALRAEFGEDRVRPLVLDASDRDLVAAGVDVLVRAGVRLDGLVLSAGPAVLESSLHPDTVTSFLQYVDVSLAVALNPLTAVLPLLRSGAWIVFLSSGAVDDVPARYPHYFVGKSALEALGRYCAIRHEARVLLARAPKMWTDLSNGPMGGRGLVPPARVASTITAWVLGDLPADDTGVTVLSPRELSDWTPVG
ncbi:SDR family NAD(P)-dependent oxidoreductase [Saccharomonospora glauca]|jgi:NADP-dependent 3-hydroxy acid dehydrogenase YdfG|uniref:MaoC-like domain-containing protein n=1 Tax=Saccharomonospora glauca K62 TaxID=928724 RepID=I1D201_9PSEU|nr:SDR family oxidoreductase [Saccharomonospora glauca]EIE98975.1 dehydrogenase of unknown specificity [Saccharomonospora glauca K62]